VKEESLEGERRRVDQVKEESLEEEKMKGVDQVMEGGEEESGRREEEGGPSERRVWKKRRGRGKEGSEEGERRKGAGRDVEGVGEKGQRRGRDYDTIDSAGISKTSRGEITERERGRQFHFQFVGEAVLRSGPE
jgi:chromatin remodeling complex protein RSC6